MDLSIISALLRAIAGVAVNPSFGSAQAVSAVANLGASLLDAGESGVEGLKELTEQVEGMVSAGRSPTPDEFRSLRARSDAAHLSIQGAGVAKQNVSTDTKKVDVPPAGTQKARPVTAQTTSDQKVAPKVAPKTTDAQKTTDAPKTAPVVDGQGSAVSKDSGSVIPPKSDASVHKS